MSLTYFIGLRSVDERFLKIKMKSFESRTILSFNVVGEQSFSIYKHVFLNIYFILQPAKPSFPSVVCSLFGLFGVPSQISQDDMVSLLKRKMHNSEKSLVLYPECATTNGQKGMLR